jgi:hopanoid biosynthesis associated protein HpnK
MAARLIVNADDFGLTRGVNRAIGELAAVGAITSATLMANGAAFDDAVSVAKANPQLGVGCHIVLVDGVPASPLERIPTLLGKDRRGFRTSLPEFVRDLFLRRIDPLEIEREALAQVRKLQDAGIRITHLDTHKHTHIFPQVARALVRAMHTAGIRAMRNPFEPKQAHTSSSWRRALMMRATDCLEPRFRTVAEGLLHPDALYGVSATGDLSATTLRAILDGLPGEGIYEMLCHPGYNDAELDAVTTRLREHREVERAALLSEMVKISSRPNAPRLIHYGDLHASDLGRK